MTTRTLVALTILVLLAVGAQSCSGIPAPTPGLDLAGQPLGTYQSLSSSPAKPISDLIAQRLIELNVRGSSIDRAMLEFRLLTDEPVRLNLPLGTMLEPESAAEQTMVVRREMDLLVPAGSDEWQQAEVLVACANRDREVPGSTSTLEVRPGAPDGELALLLPVLARTEPDFAVEQAAVWIVTDDANYEELGRLTFGGVARVITEKVASQAARLVREAGIDITQKRIWHDREQIGL